MKKLIFIIAAFFLLFLSGCGGDNSGSSASSGFGSETEVSITGYTGDAMEPFISGDGQYLFFNSLNTASDVRVYHALRVSDTEFTSCGELSGSNSAGSLDAVPSMTDSGQFFWVTNDSYPNTYHTGSFSFSAPEPFPQPPLFPGIFMLRRWICITLASYGQSWTRRSAATAAGSIT